MKSHIDNDERVVKNFSQITAIAIQMREALLARDWISVAELLSEEWENRKRNFKGISTPKIDRMIEQTRQQGTVAAKVCGAGGGGCVVFMVRPGTKPAIENTLTQMGGKVINFAISKTGLEVQAVQVEPVRKTR
jgi:D-glycero-alpha-D-manno-heptose-7-phosphate kinase